jgi:hypothetical protein
LHIPVIKSTIFKSGAKPAKSVNEVVVAVDTALPTSVIKEVLKYCLLY